MARLNDLEVAVLRRIAAAYLDYPSLTPEIETFFSLARRPKGQILTLGSSLTWWHTHESGCQTVFDPRLGTPGSALMECGMGFLASCS
jgi:hypothetical protein